MHVKAREKIFLMHKLSCPNSILRPFAEHLNFQTVKGLIRDNPLYSRATNSATSTKLAMILDAYESPREDLSHAQTFMSKLELAAFCRSFEFCVKLTGRFWESQADAPDMAPGTQKRPRHACCAPPATAHIMEASADLEQRAYPPPRPPRGGVISAISRVHTSLGVNQPLIL